MDGSGVVILGAGVAGLGCAKELPGATIFEAVEHPGGHAYSHPLGEFAFDEGAHISHTKDDQFLALIKRHAGAVRSFEPSIVRNYFDGTWTGYPIQNSLADLGPSRAADALADLVIAHLAAGDDKPATYEAWCRQQYGDFLTDNFYALFTRKYWRRALSELSTDWLGGRLIPSQVPNVIRGALGQPVQGQASFTRFHYPRSGGFFRFFETMYTDLDVRLGRRAVEIDPQHRRVTFADGSSDPYDHLASSIPLPELVAIMPDAPSSVREAAGRLRHTKLLCVNLIVGRPDVTDMHWCYVYDEDLAPARISFPSNLSPGPNARATAIQAEVYRDHREAWDPAVLYEQTLSALGTILGFDHERDVTDAGYVVVPYGYVVSDHQRAAAVDHIVSWLDEVQIDTMGLYGRWKYLWSDQAYASGRATARRIKERRGK